MKDQGVRQLVSSLDSRRYILSLDLYRRFTELCTNTAHLSGCGFRSTEEYHWQVRSTINLNLLQEESTRKSVASPAHFLGIRYINHV